MTGKSRGSSTWLLKKIISYRKANSTTPTKRIGEMDFAKITLDCAQHESLWVPEDFADQAADHSFAPHLSPVFLFVNSIQTSP